MLNSLREQHPAMSWRSRWSAAAIGIRARGHKPAGDEIDARAEAVRKGVDGAKVSALAKSTVVK